MGVTAYLRKNWGKDAELTRSRLIKWRRQPSTVRLDKPTRIDRARALGFKAKKGVFIVRQRLLSGPHRRTMPNKGRKPRKMHTRLNLAKSYRLIAEERANRSYRNCEVLNSYFVAKDGKNYWYEVILVDRAEPTVLKDIRLNHVSRQKGRVFRGLTSAGKKMRGLRA